MQHKLKNKEEEQALTSRINRLNDLRAGGGTPKPKDGGGSAAGGSGTGGGTGLISTWKKLKGKKKKQRNLTAPEISTQDIKAVSMMNDTSTSTLTPVMERDKKEGKTKTRFGRKQSKDKSGLDPKELRTSSVAEIVFKNDLADSPLLSEETSLSQMSPSLDGSHVDPAASDIDVTPPPAIPSSDIIVLEPLDLSQTSEKHSGVSLSQSEPFTGTDEHFNTQSSTSETAISSGLTETNEGWDNKEVLNEDDIHYEGTNFQGSSRMYKEYGSKQHKLNLERVHTFLESSGETEAVDLSVLQDWDGWMVASREIM